MPHPVTRLKGNAGSPAPLEPREPVAYPAYPRRPANLTRPLVRIVSEQPHLLPKK